MSGSSTSFAVSSRERAFVRHATLLTKRKKQDVDRALFEAAITHKNDGYEEYATNEKYSAPRNTVKHWFYGPSNS